MTRIQRQSYASFSSHSVGEDAFTKSLANAYDDGRSLALEGRKLNVSHIAGQALRVSFARGFKEAHLPHPATA
jgi:hypothetical protein